MLIIVIGEHIKMQNHKNGFTLAEGATHVNLLPTKVKFGFTLAEVLITLGIIGVVAALTIPTLITHYKKVRTVTVLKESYSIMQQAIKLSQDDNGDVDGWDTSLNGSQFFHKYIANYVKWQKEYTKDELNSLAPHYFLNGQLYTRGFFDFDGVVHFSLLNGSMVSIKKLRDGMMLAIDVNELTKPNRMGIDTFFLIFTPQYGLLPWGDKGTELADTSETYGLYDRSKVMGNGPYTCNKDKAGKWCTALIVRDGWKIADDYPWK